MSIADIIIILFVTFYAVFVMFRLHAVRYKFWANGYRNSMAILITILIGFYLFSAAAIIYL
jgi:hypothetical protein